MESQEAPTMTPQAPGHGGTSSSAPKRPSDFSIEHILRNAGKEGGGSKGGVVAEGNPVLVDTRERQPQLESAATRFEWLQCTRYHPPKLPRSRRKEGPSPGGRPGGPQREGGRRKLGRNPRIPFSSGQVSALEARFRKGHYLSSADVAALASALDLSEARVKIWFQNRRARERRDREAARASSEGTGVDGDHLGGQGARDTTGGGGGLLDTPLKAVGLEGGQPESPPPAGLSLFQRPTTLQGPHSAFVPFPRGSRDPVGPSLSGASPLALMAAYLGKAPAPL